MRALKYFFDEATASLWRGFKTAIIATATITVAFVVLGGFLILTSNMERVFTRWQDAAEFSVYLSDTASPEQRAAIEKTLREQRGGCGASRSCRKKTRCGASSRTSARSRRPRATSPRIHCRRRSRCGCGRTRIRSMSRRSPRRRQGSRASPMCGTTVNGFSG